MLKKTLLGILLLLALPAAGSGYHLQTIMMSNGEQYIPCDGYFRDLYPTRLVGKTVHKVYLFANLVTDPTKGADIVIRSSEHNPIGDLHLFNHFFNQGAHKGWRQGQYERDFGLNGIYIADDTLHITVICWGGGSIEVFGVIWVR